jgi:transcriptional regulator with XRE-family HTH domain
MRFSGVRLPPMATSSARSSITMRDIAAASGVSQSTVSRVLNNAPAKVPIAEIIGHAVAGAVALARDPSGSRGPSLVTFKPERGHVQARADVHESTAPPAKP